MNRRSMIAPPASMAASSGVASTAVIDRLPTRPGPSSPVVSWTWRWVSAFQLPPQVRYSRAIRPSWMRTMRLPTATLSASSRVR